MKGTLYILCIVLLICIVNAHGQGAKHHEGKEGAPHHHGQDKLTTEKTQVSKDACFYSSSSHQTYDLHLINTYFPGDLHHYDAKTGNTLYFNPCGSVRSSPACGQNSSICLVSPNGKAVSYASSHKFLTTLLPASSPNSSPALEVMFGDGEVCSNGVARKAVVTYTCNHLAEISHSFNNYKNYYPIKSAEVDPCFVSINIETPFACPVTQYCSSIRSNKDCDNQPTCGWMFGKCQQINMIFGFEIGLTLFGIMALFGSLFLCCCVCCMCAFVKRSKKCKNTTAKNQKKTRKVSQKKSKKQANTIEMDSFEVPYQLLPGGYVAVEEYGQDRV